MLFYFIRSPDKIRIWSDDWDCDVYLEVSQSRFETIRSVLAELHIPIELSSVDNSTCSDL